jgi:hypothetical protein
MLPAPSSVLQRQQQMRAGLSSVAAAQTCILPHGTWVAVCTYGTVLLEVLCQLGVGEPRLGGPARKPRRQLVNQLLDLTSSAIAVT